MEVDGWCGGSFGGSDVVSLGGVVLAFDGLGEVGVAGGEGGEVCGELGLLCGCEVVGGHFFVIFSRSTSVILSAITCMALI